MIYIKLKIRYLLIALFFGFFAIQINNHINIILEKINDSNREIFFWTTPSKPTNDLAIHLLLEATSRLPADQGSRVLHISMYNFNDSWLLLDVVKGYQQGIISNAEWQSFLKTAIIPEKIIQNKNQQEQEQKQKRQELRQKLLIQKEHLEVQKQYYQAAFYICLVIFSICLILFFRDNYKLVGDASMKNIVLIGNSIIILAASWSYVEREGIVFSLALVICAILNAFLIIKGFTSQELTIWASYTINVFLLFSGIWLYNEGYHYWKAECKIGFTVGIVSLLNLYYRFKTSKAITTPARN